MLSLFWAPRLSARLSQRVVCEERSAVVMRAFAEGSGIHRKSLTSGAQCVGGVDPSD